MSLSRVGIIWVISSTEPSFLMMSALRHSGNMLDFYSVKSGHCHVHKLESLTLLGEVECAIAFRVDEAVLVVAHH